MARKKPAPGDSSDKGKRRRRTTNANLRERATKRITTPKASGSKHAPDAAARATDPENPGRHSNGKNSFPIVGIGASAGGLEAFTELLKHLPIDTGLGFVLVQHLDPQHESALTQLLSRATAMPVREVTNNVPVEANHVYVIPPNTTLSIASGALKLQPRKQGRTPPRSIDSFFESLAQDQRERAIGVILSGTASDGTMGLEAIKGEGGITFAQDATAKYDSMPRSAVAAGCVDFVLAPADIANELARIAKHPYVAGQAHEDLTPEENRASATEHEDDASALPSGGHGSPRTEAKRARVEAASERGKAGEDGFKRILLLLRNHSGVDFSLYRSSTIQRRITRRVILNKLDSLDDYANFVKGNSKELDALYSDVLISVTSFFRNPDAFEVLKRKVFPKLLEQRGDDPFRVWVLGCSTGQEAYSIAMAFMESAEKAPRLRKLQVFATDLNEALLDKARHGLYAKSLAEDVSPERLRRFFVEEEGGYRIVKSLREMVIFARQNLISDPPFSRMDLISCRNLLIYLEPGLQKKALPTFHYSLKPGGFLFLGVSESIGSFTDLFEPVDKKQKIYTKKTASMIPTFHLPVRRDHRALNLSTQTVRPPFATISPQEESPGLRSELSVQREADRMSINRFAPPGVLINAELQILQFRGPTSAYLQPPVTGKASFDVLKMAREGLMLPLRATINKAKEENTIARRDNVRVTQNGDTRSVNIEVVPIKNLREPCFLIFFEDAEKLPRAEHGLPASELQSAATRTSRRTSRKEETRRSIELERELAETIDYLQSIQEQYEAANEELQASNEEVQSANEELQSINEELETSKEELESANEELTTVNEEMAHRNADLGRLNSDLVNLQTSTHLAIVLLGRDLTIHRFSVQAQKQFNLLATDVGRPISNVRHNLDLPDLEDLIGEVISRDRETEREVRGKDGHWYSLLVRPYISLDNKVDGAVLVLVDINALKQALNYADAIIDTVREPLLVLDERLCVRRANRSFYEDFHVSPEQTEDRFIYDLGNRQWDIPKLRTLLNEILPENHEFQDFEVDQDFEGLGRRTMLLNARRLEQDASGGQLILLAIEDITERKQAEWVLTQSHAQLQAHAEELRRFNVVAVGRELRMIELKKEINNFAGSRTRLSGIHSNSSRMERIPMSESRRRESTNELPSDNIVPLESVLCTEELNKRPPRPSDYETENRALVSLAQELALSRQTILQTLADKILEVLRVGSVGISLLSLDGKTFYWPAIAGMWKPHVGGGTPRDFGPCGDVLDRNAPLMFRHPELRYTYFLPVTPPVEECILVPFYVEGKAVGTVWAIAHDDRRKFDGEDMRQLVSLGSFASTAYQAVTMLDAKKQQDETLKQTHTELAQNIVELQEATIQAQDSRRAALNLMEDAVQSREAMLKLNTEIRAKEVLVESQRQALQMLAEGASLELILGFLIDVVEHHSPEGMLAAITPLNEAGTCFERGTGPSLPEAFKAAVAGVEVSSPSGLCANAVRRCEAIAVPDFNAEEEWQPFGEFVAPYGLRSGWSIPIISSSGQMLGTFSNYYRHVCDPTPQNREFVDMVVRSAAIAIERKRAEKERERLLANEHEARKEAETANRVKDEFLAVVSHELRTPLNAILGWAHLLMRGSLDEKNSARGLETITRNAKAQNQLISDLLDVSRIISGQLRCEIAAVDLIPLINAAVDTVRPAADAKGVQLNLSLEPAAGMVSGDAARLQQIVSNLLTNAVKFTPQDGHIDVHLKRKDTSVVIIVSDTGEGISPEFLPFIFDRFRQAEGTSSRHHGGLGLGLAIVRHLVELHQGTVSAASEGVGKGATFRAAFPCIAVTRIGTDLESEDGVTGSYDDNQSSLLQGVHVLVVDDEPDARELLTIALSHSSAEVRAVGTAREALEVFDQWKPDVLISDIGMPGEDGYELIRKVRTLEGEHGGTVPAVALTGYASDEDAARARIAGFQLHLSKPVSPNDLVAAVATLALKARHVGFR